MNILVIGKFHEEGFGLHIAETLRMMGHTVACYEPGPRHLNARGSLLKRIEQAGRAVYGLTEGVPQLQRWRSRSLYMVAQASRPQLVLSCHDFLFPEQCRELKRRTGAQIALWFPDPISYFGRAKFLLAPYDALFFKDPYVVHSLRDVLKGRVHYLPECFNPHRHRLPNSDSIDTDSYRCDLTTAGNMHAYRIAFLSQLRRYHMKIWGNPPPVWAASPWLDGVYQGRFVANEEKALAFRGAKIVINNLLPAEIWGVNVRTFEAAGIGAFQLVDWRPGLGELFDDPSEIVSFRGIDDLLEKIDYYLGHEAERDRIRIAGQARAHNSHTYAHRIELLLDTLAGKKRGHESGLLE